MISTHAPLAGRDCDLIRTSIQSLDFNPRAPCGARRRLRGAQRLPVYFNPRAPCGARHGGGKTASCGELIFQPTRPLRGATPPPREELDAAIISTHAPLAGRDSHTSYRFRRPCISTHAPLAGRDCRGRRTTSRFCHFNPRAPCGARHQEFLLHTADVRISTHAPLAGRDSNSNRSQCRDLYFNPRAPCGARQTSNHFRASPDYFNPRAPCGARLRTRRSSTARSTFQPTRPLRGATAKVYKSLCTFLR